MIHGHGVRPSKGRGAAFVEYSLLLLLIALTGLIAFNGVGSSLAAYFALAAKGI